MCTGYLAKGGVGVSPDCLPELQLSIPVVGVFGETAPTELHEQVSSLYLRLLLNSHPCSYNNEQFSY